MTILIQDLCTRLRCVNNINTSLCSRVQIIPYTNRDCIFFLRKYSYDTKCSVLLFSKIEIIHAHIQRDRERTMDKE